MERYHAEWLPNGLIRVFDRACKWALLYQDVNGLATWYSGQGHDNPQAWSAAQSLIRASLRG